MSGSPSGQTRSRHLRHEHRQLATEWARAAADPTYDGLASLGRRVQAHLAEEEQAVHPVVRQHLPAGTGTIDAVREEQATLLSLIELLEARLAAVGADRSAVAVIVRDIEQLWRAHVRRFDRVIGPLLRRLDAGEGAS